MKHLIHKTWRIMRWPVAAIAAFYIFGIAWSGITRYDRDTGFVVFKWSGLDALFNDQKFGFRTNYQLPTELGGIDGPYVMRDGTVITVDENNHIGKRNITADDSVLVRVPNKDEDAFWLRLQDSITIQPAVSEMPSRLIAISDIEGNFNALHSFLTSNGVMDKNYNWAFGNGHLVLLGDFVDRGEQVTQVLWLIYSLEDKARQAGGAVHFILGNHEALNAEGRAGYADRKYIRIAQELSGEEQWNKAFRYLNSDQLELGRWLRTKNAMEKIGDYLFVHGGLSPELLQYKKDIVAVNNTIRQHLDQDLHNNPSGNAFADFLKRQKGPLWFRGLVTETKHSEKVSQQELERILAFYDCRKAVIGHTIAEDIIKDYNGRLLRIDVMHGKEKNSGKTKGLLIEHGAEYIIDDKGRRVNI